MRLILIFCLLGIIKIKGGSSTAQSQNSWSSFDSLYWPNLNSIPYYIDTAFNATERRLIKDAVAELSGSLDTECLRFQELRLVIPVEKEYIYFIQLLSDDCSSDLGMQQGVPTKIKLGQTCFEPGVILHELVHALGAAHEQTRPDRDFYVSLNLDNIEVGRKENFLINKNFTETSQTPYDYLSITHYPGNAFARKESLSTISSKFGIGKDALTQGNRQLSATDKIEISQLYNCVVDKSVEEEYLNYIDELFTEVMEGFRICIENNTRPDENCKDFRQQCEFMLVETRRLSPRNLFHAHNIEYQVALNRLNQRRTEWNTEIQLQGFSSKSIVSATRFHKELMETRKENQNLKEGLNTQDEKIQLLREDNQKLKEGLKSNDEQFEQLRKQNEELRDELISYFKMIDQDVFKKPWFGEPGVKIFNKIGYQVIESKSPWCKGKLSAGKIGEASINSQAELDFISELLGDRVAWLGGFVNMTSNRPSYADFYWKDRSNTTFLHTLTKKFTDHGAVRYSPWLKSGEIYFGIQKPRPNLMVCKYP